MPLVHTYSRNKSDREDCLFFIVKFLIHAIYGINNEIDKYLPIITSPCKIQRFQPKNSFQNKSRTKSSLLSQTFSWTKFMPLSWIHPNGTNQQNGKKQTNKQTLLVMQCSGLKVNGGRGEEKLLRASGGAYLICTGNWAGLINLHPCWGYKNI